VSDFGPPRRPRDDGFDQLGFRPMPATEWLAPRRYLRTTLQTALADVAASFTDRRDTLAALDPRPEPAADLDRSRDEELWIDYVADTGDGFDHTFPVAWALAQDELAVEGCAEPLPAGRLLVFGGDQVYPVASDDSYRDRFSGVFRAALPWRDEGATRDAAAIPGNHDWYDGLGAFSRTFCQQRWLGAWRTHQRRSYFAVALPHHWWLWGVDIALAGLVDQAQLDYFDVLAARAARDAAAEGATARLVIVTAKPSWLDAVETAPRDVRIDPALEHLEIAVAARHGIDVAAVIAGDKHFYARFEPEHGEGPSRIVSGGGGAFIHPTDHVPDRVSIAHSPERQLDDEPLRLVELQPTRKRSRQLRARTLWFGFRNGAFAAVTALAYLTWLGPAPVRVAVAAATLAGAIALARRPSLPRGLVWATPHAAAHVGCMALAVAVADSITDTTSVWWRAVALLIAGGLVAPVVVGLYFLIVGTIGGVNDNEAFAAIRVREHKGFVRLHIDHEGRMRAFAIGIDDPPPRGDWHVDPTGPPGAPWFTSASPVRARLMDGPITLGGLPQSSNLSAE